MSQNQYVQKPYKVLAEQYTAAASPPPAGVCLLAHPAAGVAPGVPHVHTTQPLGIFTPKEGDWIVQEMWAPYGWLIIPDAEFQDRF